MLPHVGLPAARVVAWRAAAEVFGSPRQRCAATRVSCSGIQHNDVVQERGSGDDHAADLLALLRAMSKDATSVRTPRDREAARGASTSRAASRLASSSKIVIAKARPASASTSTSTR